MRGGQKVTPGAVVRRPQATTTMSNQEISELFVVLSTKPAKKPGRDRGGEGWLPFGRQPCSPVGEDVSDLFDRKRIEWFREPRNLTVLLAKPVLFSELVFDLRQNQVLT